MPGDGYGCSGFRLGALTLTLMPNAAEPSPAAFLTLAKSNLHACAFCLGQRFLKNARHSGES
jgi:hypothetical protein